MMEKVVEEGTGRAARISGVRVAGKTGTAEVGKGTPHAWFVGFAPADDPEIVVAVIVENAGTGGRVAAPIAREVMKTWIGKND
jgi:peptidoglycan glycosyltransferase